MSSLCGEEGFLLNPFEKAGKLVSKESSEEMQDIVFSESEDGHVVTAHLIQLPRV